MRHWALILLLLPAVMQAQFIGRLKVPVVLPLDQGSKWNIGKEVRIALPPAAKLSPDIDWGDTHSRLLLVELYAGADADVVRRVVWDLGLALSEHPDLAANHLLITAPPGRAAALAQSDDVAYLFPAHPDFGAAVPFYACQSAISALSAQPVGQYMAELGDGWDGAGLGPANVSYFFGGMTPQLPSDSAQAEIARAMAEWSKHVRVRFQPVSRAETARAVDILFGRGSHGDPYAFDGRGRVLAHTFYPSPPNPEPIAGDMHFDDDESWRIGADLDLFSVALHELGHALGLAHSDRPEAVMYPYYRRVTALNDVDIQAIRRIYATDDTSSTPTTTPTTPVQPTQPNDTTPPSLTITSPLSTTVSTGAASITCTGTSSDGASGVAEVTWRTSTGKSGVAIGRTQWSARDIPLLVGFNTIRIESRDAAGNTAWRSLVVTRR